MMPSKYIPVLKKEPDKMGFDEVRNESCENDSLSSHHGRHHSNELLLL